MRDLREISLFMAQAKMHSNVLIEINKPPQIRAKLFFTLMIFTRIGTFYLMRWFYLTMTFSNRLYPIIVWLFELQFFIFPPKCKSWGRCFKKEIIELLTKVTKYYLYELNWNSFSRKTFPSDSKIRLWQCRLLLVPHSKCGKRSTKICLFKKNISRNQFWL